MAIKNIFPRFGRDAGQGWEIAAKTTVIISVFLLPLLSFTWTADWWELHKVTWLLLTVTIGWVCSLMASIRRRRNDWHWTRLDLLVGLFGLLMIASTAFSVRFWQSLIGVSGTMSGTLTTTLALIGLYGLVGHLFRGPAERRWLGGAVLIGLAGTLLLQMAQLSGVSFLPTGYPHDQPFFSVLGNSPHDTAVMAGLFGSLMLLWWPAAKERWQRAGVASGVLLSWLILFLYGTWLGWLTLVVGAVVIILVQALQGKKANVRMIGLALVVVVLGLVSQMTGIYRQASLPRQTEIRLDHQTSASVALKTVLRRPVTGSGPETWYQDFVRNRPLAYNQSANWNIRFVKSSNGWWQMVATVGVVGTLLFLILLVRALAQAGKQMSKGGDQEATAVLVILAITLMMGLFTTWSLPLLMLAWVALGYGRTWSATFKGGPAGMGTVIALVGVVLIGGALWWVVAQTYIGEVLLARVQPAISRQEPLASIRQRLQDVLDVNPYNTEARVLLANGFLVDGLLQAHTGNTVQAQPLLEQGLTTMDDAVKRDSGNPQVYEQYNNVLNSMVSFDPTVDQRALKNFDALRQREPSSPIHDLGYGQVLLLQRARLLQAEAPSTAEQQQAAQLLQDALTSFNTSLSKKPDYVQARVSRAQTLLESGQYQQALTDYDDLSKTIPSADIWRDRGVALSKLKQNDQAVASFRQALTANPQDIGTYVALADHWLSVDNKDEARKILDEGLKVLPDDATLKEKRVSIQ